MDTERVLFTTRDGRQHDHYCLMLQFARENLRDAGETFTELDAKHLEWAAGAWESLEDSDTTDCGCAA